MMVFMKRLKNGLFWNKKMQALVIQGTSSPDFSLVPGYHLEFGSFTVFSKPEKSQQPNKKTANSGVSFFFLLPSFMVIQTSSHHPPPNAECA